MENNNFTKRDVDSLAAWGFNSIRIPMHYNLFFTLPIQDEPEAGKDTWLDTGFDIVDKVLEWSLPHEMYVILDLHLMMTRRSNVRMQISVTMMTLSHLYGKAMKIKEKQLRLFLK